MATTKKTAPISATITVKQPDPTDPALAVKLVEVCLLTTYDQAAASFKQNPSTGAWNKLTEVMHAWQFWSGLGPDRRVTYAAGLTMNHGIGQWPAFLKKAQVDAFQGPT